MIRFIYIGDQIMDDEKYFAFFDTITNRFLEFDGEQVFDSWEEFVSYWRTGGKGEPLMRFQIIYESDHPKDVLPDD